MQFIWFVNVCSHFFNFKICRKLLYEFFVGQIIQIFNYTVIVNNIQLIIGKTYRHKVIIFFVAGVVWVLSALFVTHQGSCRTTVMPIGNIKRRNLCKKLRNTRYRFGIINYPKMMTEAIAGSHKIINRFPFNYVSHNSIQFILMRISKKYRFDISIVYTNVLHSVFFLIAAGKFVFFDVFVHVIVHMRTDYQSILRFAIHCLRVHVVFFSFILHQPTFGFEFCKVLKRFIVHFIFVFVGSLFKINLGFNNVIQRHCIAFGLCAGFFGVQHIVRARSHFFN